MDMQQFIYILKIVPHYRINENWTDDTSAIVGQHFNHLKKLMDEGIVVMAGKTDYDRDNDENFGIVLFNAENEAKARDLMNSDPAIINQVMSAELHPFRIALPGS